MELSRCNRSSPCHFISHMIMEHLKVVLGSDATRVSCSSVVFIVIPHLLPMWVSLKTHMLWTTPVNQSALTPLCQGLIDTYLCCQIIANVKGPWMLIYLLAATSRHWLQALQSKSISALTKC